MTDVLGAQTTLTLMAPKATGTPGDTLVAWGLAIFASEALRPAPLETQSVQLSDRGDHFLIETEVTTAEAERRLASFSWRRLNRGKLLWLASTQNKRMPPSEGPVPWAELKNKLWFDRDALREDHKLWRMSHAAMQTPAGGDAPTLTSEQDPQLYPFYEVLTNPGTQWAGYDSFVERLYGLLTPEGARALLVAYGAFSAGEHSGSEEAARGRRSKAPTLNPPGFLYPGMNKGPTMRVVEEHGASVGTATAPDWMLADRGDRSVFENYLAYIGYFQVARIVTTKEQRVVAVPMPAQVWAPDILRELPTRELEATSVTDYLAAQNALDYGLAALKYVSALQGTQAQRLVDAGLALNGAHLSVFWRPNGNVFAPSRLTQVSLPRWLPALREQLGLGSAKETLTEHMKRLKAIRGRWRDEKKLPAEQRWAIEAYLRSLNGGPREWFQAVAAWFPAARAADNNGWNIGLWSIDEVRRITAAMRDDQSEILNVLRDEAFERLTSAIRGSTVAPHINRERRKRGETTEVYPYQVNYDLTASLVSAAERGPDDFLREFYSFAARYNDETARPQKMTRPGEPAVSDEKTGARKYGRALLRANDLTQLAVWMRDRSLRELVPYALVAFGTSRKTMTTAGDVDTPTAGADTSEHEEDAEE